MKKEGLLTQKCNWPVLTEENEEKTISLLCLVVQNLTNLKEMMNAS